MKILMVSQTFSPEPIRGAERVAEDIAQSLLSRGHKVSVVALGDRTETLCHEGFVVRRLPYLNTPRPGPHSLRLGAARKLLWHARNALGGVSGRSLYSLLTEIRPEVVYIHNANGFQPQLNRLCRDLNLPVVAHLHDYGALCPRTTMYRSGRNCGRPCASCRVLTHAWRKAAIGVGDVIAVSDFVRRRHQSNAAFPTARWHVAHNADRTVLDGFTPKRGGRFAFGFIGALTEEKGLGDLLAAFAMLPVGTAELIIAGRGEDYYVREMQRRTAGQAVTWLGQTPPNRLYSSIDCLIIPSRWHEPQALVVGEGLRRALPIIASNRGGNTEVLKNRPPHLLYDPDDPRALTKAMQVMAVGIRPSAPQSLNDDLVSKVEQILRQAATEPMAHE